MNNIKFYCLIVKLFIKGYSISDIQKITSEYKMKTEILKFRSTALLFGADVSTYSDDELLQSINENSKEIAKLGLSVEEVGIALNAISNSFAEFKPELIK